MDEMACNPKQVLEYLQRRGFENPYLETQLILHKVLDKSIDKVDIYSTTCFHKEQMEHLGKFWPSLTRGQPIQYQIGFTYVSGLKIHISNDTLCPGPEIEILIEAARQRVGRENGIAVDLCTGSGVIGTILAKEFPGWQIYATDISKSALLTAARNKHEHNVGNLHLLEGDLLAPLSNLDLRGQIDLIVSNPPYCRTSIIDKLPIQVKDYAPRIAIAGGSDGLHFFQRIFEETTEYLKPGGFLILENDTGQSKSVQSLMTGRFKLIDILENHLGISRVLVIQYI